jgi:hemerythrin
MDFVELGYEYLLNVPEIDNQHKELAKQLNNAIKHCTGKKTDEKIFYEKNIRKSIDFLRNHFETEEKILCKTKYENFKKHKLEHKNILKEIIKMNNNIEKNKMELDLFYVMAFIKERIMKHLKTYDIVAKKYFIEGNEIK